MIPGIVAGRAVPSPVGEVTLTAASGTWVCPAGVTRVCAVLVGKGGKGVNQGGYWCAGGDGGALAFKNNIAVVPGTSYSFVIGSTTQIFGLRVFAGVNGYSSPNYQNRYGSEATTDGAPDGRCNGAAAYSVGDPERGAVGGGAGRYEGTPAAAGVGVGLFGTGSTGSYGAGGVTAYSYSGRVTPGGPGAIRIIWGTGRSFPSNAS